MSKRDKYLTEYMGKCYHQWDCCPRKECGYLVRTCETCGGEFEEKYSDPIMKNTDFATWQGYGELSGHFNVVNMWPEFEAWLWKMFRDSTIKHWEHRVPNERSDLIYQFLQERS